MADPEIVTADVLYNTNRVKLENLRRRIFECARLDIEITDRFLRLLVLREWFLLSLFAIYDVIERIRDGSIKGLAYGPETDSLR